jgi:hypothetical protein
MSQEQNHSSEPKPAPSDKPSAAPLEPVVQFQTGQVWETSNGFLWMVEHATSNGSAILRRGSNGIGRRMFKARVPARWKLNPEGLLTRHLVEGTQHPLVGHPDDLTKNGQ